MEVLIASLFAIGLFIAGSYLRAMDERTKWCEHLHKEHKAVKQCEDKPDWEGEK